MWLSTLGSETVQVTTFDAFHSTKIHQAAETHLLKVWEAFYDEENNTTGELIPTPAVGPFCGCETCLVREVIAGAWPAIEQYFALKLAGAEPYVVPGADSP